MLDLGMILNTKIGEVNLLGNKEMSNIPTTQVDRELTMSWSIIIYMTWKWVDQREAARVMTTKEQ